MGFYIGTGKASRPREGFIPNPKIKLLEQVSEVMRFKHYSIRTETTYREWIKRFILFHGKRHPREMGAAEVERFLSDLAVRRKVAASTQNQAFSAGRQRANIEGWNIQHPTSNIQHPPRGYSPQAGDWERQAGKARFSLGGRCQSGGSGGLRGQNRY